MAVQKPTRRLSVWRGHRVLVYTPAWGTDAQLHTPDVITVQWDTVPLIRFLSGVCSHHIRVVPSDRIHSPSSKGKRLIIHPHKPYWQILASYTPLAQSLALEVLGLVLASETSGHALVQDTSSTYFSPGRLWHWCSSYWLYLALILSTYTNAFVLVSKIILDLFSDSNHIKKHSCYLEIEGNNPNHTVECGHRHLTFGLKALSYILVCAGRSIF